MPDPFEATCYRRNFLKQAIARVDFLSPLPSVDVTLPRAVRDAALAGFPIPEPKDSVHREFNIDSATGEITRRERPFKEWVFHGTDRTKKLNISGTSVVADYLAYTTYEALRAEFSRIIEVTASSFPDAQPQRLGLRYINVLELDGDPLDWSQFVNPALLAGLNFPPASDRAGFTRALQNLELNFDGFNLRYISGIANPDFPARVRRKSFVLDLDAYTQSVPDIRGVVPVLDQLHSKIQEYFEASITESLRSRMNAD